MNGARQRREQIRERAKAARSKAFVQGIADACERFRAGEVTPSEPEPEKPKTFQAEIVIKSHISFKKKLPQIGTTKEILNMQENGFWVEEDGAIFFIPPKQILGVIFQTD